MNEPTTLSTEEHAGGLKVIRFSGDLDSMGTHMVENRFKSALGQQDQRVVVDMSQVGFISSAGMAMLLVRGKRLRQHGGQLLIAGANTRVLEVLSLAGFNELFDVYATLDEALESLNSPPLD